MVDTLLVLIILTNFMLLASSRIPVSRTGVFVGRGFEWEARHVARLAQALPFDRKMS